jgi:hypothetical protein
MCPLLCRPKYVDLETQAENLTPEAFASFPSKEGGIYSIDINSETDQIF